MGRVNSLAGSFLRTLVASAFSGAVGHANSLVDNLETCDISGVAGCANSWAKSFLRTPLAVCDFPSALLHCANSLAVSLDTLFNFALGCNSTLVVEVKVW